MVGLTWIGLVIAGAVILVGRWAIRRARRRWLVVIVRHEAAAAAEADRLRMLTTTPERRLWRPARDVEQSGGPTIRIQPRRRV